MRRVLKNKKSLKTKYLSFLVKFSDETVLDLNETIFSIERVKRKEVRRDVILQFLN
jgi:hypothetical protein